MSNGSDRRPRFSAILATLTLSDVANNSIKVVQDLGHRLDGIKKLLRPLSAYLVSLTVYPNRVEVNVCLWPFISGRGKNRRGRIDCRRHDWEDSLIFVSLPLQVLSIGSNGWIHYDSPFTWWELHGIIQSEACLCKGIGQRGGARH